MHPSRLSPHGMSRRWVAICGLSSERGALSGEVTVAAAQIPVAAGRRVDDHAEPAGFG
jgi:hypothetical protein